MYSLVRELWLPKPLPFVFKFFERPENLSLLTPKNLSFAVRTPSPVPMHKDARISYGIRVLGQPLDWVSRITVYDPPYRFVDEQETGPYSYWHHEHSFQVKDNGTLVRDEVQYSISYGWMGRLAHVLFVRRELNHIFDYRAKTLRRLLAS